MIAPIIQVLGFCFLALSFLVNDVAAGTSKPPGGGTQQWSDLDLLNYALSLEHLEYAFYRDGLIALGNSSGNSTIWARIEEIRDHEKAHLDLINTTIVALGGTPVQECTYNFNFTNASSMLNLARTLENVGTSAYDGALYRLQNNVLQAAASSIATVEARHAAWLNQVNKVDPFPTAFDSGLDPQSVLTLAAPFIKNCTGPTLKIKARPWLTVSPQIVTPGSFLNVSWSTLSSSPSSSSSSNWWCLFYAGGVSKNSSLVTYPTSDNSTGSSAGSSTGNSSATYYCIVPTDAYQGDNYVFVSKSKSYSLVDQSGILAGPAIIYVNGTTNNSTSGGTSNNSTSGGT